MQYTIEIFNRFNTNTSYIKLKPTDINYIIVCWLCKIRSLIWVVVLEILVTFIILKLMNILFYLFGIEGFQQCQS